MKKHIQVAAALLFENGKTATHTMTAFSREIYRDIKIFGTKAELVGVMEKNKIEVRTFGGGVKEIDVDISGAKTGGHSGDTLGVIDSLSAETPLSQRI